MSDLSNESIDGIAFDERTTSARFQERLMQAKTSTAFDPLDNDTRFTDSYESYDTEALKNLLEDLTKKVSYMENRVIEKENKLAVRRAKRNVEAGITNMTTEERAVYVEQEEEKQLHAKSARQNLRKKLLGNTLKKQGRIYIDGDQDDDEDKRKAKVKSSDQDQGENEEEEEDEGTEKSQDTDEDEDREKDEMEERGSEDEEEVEEDVDDADDQQNTNITDERPDWNVIYEYLLLLESESMDDDLSFGADFINPNAQMRQKAFENEQVTRQTEYSGITIKQSAYSFKDSREAGAESVRHCALSGTSFDLPFKAEFDVFEPSMVMSSLDFEVNIEMQLAVGSTLQKIKNECNIMGFFRLFVHYAKLEKQRDDIFNRLIQHYKDTPVNVILLSQTKLQFEGAVHNGSECGIILLFSWKIMETNTDREKLDANVVNDVKPNLTMEAVALSTVITKDTTGALDRVNEVFLHTIMRKGVYEGTTYIVDNILSVEHPVKLSIADHMGIVLRARSFGFHA
ncbi:hypothetical protein [Parasitella parasitica]|uniref:Uncharacterized protein n=1 Tax=Parasitella parasitica TaxID=35722 RepID=A0A0B7NT50_9FUNG|nr:hypothetical protein [Parasitella parasitica]